MAVSGFLINNYGNAQAGCQFWESSVMVSKYSIELRIVLHTAKAKM